MLMNSERAKHLKINPFVVSPLSGPVCCNGLSILWIFGLLCDALSGLNNLLDALAPGAAPGGIPV